MFSRLARPRTHADEFPAIRRMPVRCGSLRDHRTAGNRLRLSLHRMSEAIRIGVRHGGGHSKRELPYHARLTRDVRPPDRPGEDHGMLVLRCLRHEAIPCSGRGELSQSQRQTRNSGRYFVACPGDPLLDSQRAAVGCDFGGRYEFRNATGYVGLDGASGGWVKLRHGRFARHGQARPGHPDQHRIGSGGPDEP
jgi:hypothetical protein